VSTSSHSATRRLAALLIAALVVSGAAAARGAGPTDEELVKQGLEQRRHNQDAEALDLFRKAYQLRATPRTLAQIGFAEQALGRWTEAEAHLEEALAASSDGWISKNAKILNESLTRAREHLGGLEVLGEPSGAEVLVEGEVRGTLPLGKPLRVRAGECQFEVRAAGHHPVTRTVQVAAGALTRETVKLAKLAAPAASGAVEPLAGAGPGSAAEARLAAAPSSSSSDEASGRRTRRIAGLAVGGAGLAATVAGFLVYRSGKGKFDAITADATASPPRAYDEANGNWQSLERTGVGLMAAGAGVLISGALLYLFNREGVGSF
jgi:hypothetical protein